jgi:4-hydroxy-2,2'-bipyrrole-5-carbaldehyde O-methyltransferase
MTDRVVLQRLARGPATLEGLTGERSGDPSLRSATEAWLGLEVRLGVIKKDEKGYSLRGFLARRLAAPENDAVRDLIGEVAGLHHHYIVRTPEKLEKGLVWDPAELHGEYGDLIARSSRALEPFLTEVIDRTFPETGPVRLLEVGCGHAGYIMYAADRNSSLRAVGLELDPQVAEMARRTVQARGMQGRVEINVGDVRDYRSDEPFDILTLYNNIYYFPVEERTELFRRLLHLLRPNGRILLTTGCMNGGIEFELVNLIHSSTKGWGRLPDKAEMLDQLSSAGFERCSATSLVPGDKYYAFTGYRPVENDRRIR